MQSKNQAPAMTFDLGDCVVSKGIVDTFGDEFKMNKVCGRLLERHAKGDFGDLCEEDIQPR